MGSAFPTVAPADELPFGWERIWSAEQSRPYYVNRELCKSQWEAPPMQHPIDADVALQPGWEEVWCSEQRRFYYYSRGLNKTQWEKPTMSAHVPPTSTLIAPPLA